MASYEEATCYHIDASEPLAFDARSCAGLKGVSLRSPERIKITKGCCLKVITTRLRASWLYAVNSGMAPSEALGPKRSRLVPIRAPICYRTRCSILRRGGRHDRVCATVGGSAVFRTRTRRQRATLASTLGIDIIRVLAERVRMRSSMGIHVDKVRKVLHKELIARLAARVRPLRWWCGIGNVADVAGWKATPAPSTGRLPRSS